MYPMVHERSESVKQDTESSSTDSLASNHGLDLFNAADMTLNR